MAFLQDLFRPKPSAVGEGSEEKATPTTPVGPGATSDPVVDITPPKADETPAGGSLVLLLDDVLSRVPTTALKPGLHDPAQELHFALDELAEGISRGKVTVALSKLAERYPETFQLPENAEEDKAIVLPLQKLIQQIGRSDRPPMERQKVPTTATATGTAHLTLGQTSTHVPSESTATGGVSKDPPQPQAPMPPLQNEEVPPRPGLTRFQPFGDVGNFAEVKPRAGRAVEAPVEPPAKVEKSQPAGSEVSSSVADPMPPAQLRVEQANLPVAPVKVAEETKAAAPAKLPVFGEVVSSLQAPGRHKAKEVKIDARPIPPRNRFASDLAALATRSAPRKTSPTPTPSDAPGLIGQIGIPDTTEAPRPHSSESQQSAEPRSSEGEIQQQPDVASGASQSPQPKEQGSEAASSESIHHSDDQASAGEVAPNLAAPRADLLGAKHTVVDAAEPATTIEDIARTAVSAEGKPLELAADTEEEYAASSVPTGEREGDRGPEADLGKTNKEAPPVSLPTTAPMEASTESSKGSTEGPFRIPPVRPQVRPPSIHGPSGGISLSDPPPAPPVPGFVFAPRPSNLRPEFPPPPEPTIEATGIQMPRLFPVDRGLPAGDQSVVPTPPVEQAPSPTLQEQATPTEVIAGAETRNHEAPALEPDPDTEDDHEEEKAETREHKHERRIAQVVRSEESELMGAHFALARMEQQTLQAIFMTEEFLDLPRVSQLSCNFPGVTGCMLVAGDAVAEAGERPGGLEAPALCRLSEQLVSTAAALPKESPAVQTFTLHTGSRALSIFARPHVSVCIVHSHRGFLPGVRERLSAVADTLARGLSDEPAAE